MHIVKSNPKKVPATIPYLPYKNMHVQDNEVATNPTAVNNSKCLY